MTMLCNITKTQMADKLESKQLVLMLQQPWQPKFGYALVMALIPQQTLLMMPPRHPL
jgi:hypothetical protein